MIVVDDRLELYDWKILFYENNDEDIFSFMFFFFLLVNYFGRENWVDYLKGTAL